MAWLNGVEMRDMRYTDVTINKSPEKKKYLTGLIYKDNVFVGDLFRNNSHMMMTFDEEEVREEVRNFCASCGRKFTPEEYREDVRDFFDILIRLSVIEKNYLSFYRKGCRAVLTVSSGVKVINFGLQDDIGRESAIDICTKYIEKAKQDVLHTEHPAITYITGTDFFKITADSSHPLPDILGDWEETGGNGLMS